MHLSPLQDLPSDENIQPSTRTQNAKMAQSALSQLRYDDTYNSDSLRVIFSIRGTESAKPLKAWIFDDHSSHDYIDPANVLRIERTWDGVPIWDPKQNLTRLPDFDAPAAYYFGVATLVADDDELVLASGIQKSDTGEEARRAEFQCLDDGDGDGTREFVQGIIGPPRWVEPGDQGLMLRRGPKDKRNQQLLAGTVLQNASWKDVVEYGKGMRPKPLW